MLPSTPSNPSSLPSLSPEWLSTSEPSVIEKRYWALFEQTNDAVFIIDLQGRHLEVNQRAADIFGYSTRELLAMTINDMIVEDEIPHSHIVLEQMLRGLPMPIYERQLRHKNGSSVMVEVNVALIRDQDGSPLYVQSIVRDITQRKQMELERLERERLRLELEKERDLNTLKAEVMVTIAHEFRTPLALILLQRDVLDRYHDQLTAAQRQERLGIIRKQVYRLTGLLEDMSFLVKGTINALELKPKLENVDEFISAFMVDFRQLIGPNRVIKYTCDGDLKRVCIDTAFVRRMLTNLLLNSVKYSPESGAVRLEVTRVDQCLQFVVRDQGIGIPADERAHVFDLFFRGSNAKGERGMGLGLSIVAQAVELYGGKIEVQSELGVGSVFTVSLPIFPTCAKRDEDHLGSASLRG